MSSLSLLFSGRGDEIILTVTIKKGSSILLGKIFASESEINEVKNQMSNFLSNLTYHVPKKLAVSFGPLVLGSPSLEIQMVTGERGTVLCLAKFSCYLGISYEEAPDTACVGLSTNISSLDTFLKNLSERGNEHELFATLDCN